MSAAIVITDSVCCSDKLGTHKATHEMASAATACLHVCVQEAMQDSSKIKVSLRSIGDEDTTVISQAFGGGGHRNASSFVTDTSAFRQWSQDTT